MADRMRTEVDSGRRHLADFVGTEKTTNRKGDRSRKKERRILCAASEGPSRQNEPVPFSFGLPVDHSVAVEFGRERPAVAHADNRAQPAGCLSLGAGDRTAKHLAKNLLPERLRSADLADSDENGRRNAQFTEHRKR